MKSRRAPAALVLLLSVASGAEEIVLTEGTNLSLAVAPDHSQVILAVQGTLWRVASDGGDAVQLTDPALDAHAPHWAPGGDRIAFTVFDRRGFGIALMDADGSGYRRLDLGEGDARDPYFHPDGQTLIYSGDGASGYRLFEVDLETGEKRVLSGSVDARYPAYSPGGDRIAYLAYGDEPGLYVRDRRGGAPQLLHPQTQPFGPPAWHRSGKALWFASREDGLSRMLKVTPEGAAEVIVEGLDLFPFRAVHVGGERWLYAADGGVLTHTESGETTRLPFAATLVLPERRSRSTMDRARSSGRVVGLLSPALSPQGDRYVFSAMGDLWLAPLATPENVQQLTHDGAGNVDPTWSPDGRRLAYIAARDETSVLRVMDLITGESRDVDFEGRPALPSWSPDGKRLAVVAEGSGGSLMSAGLVEVDLSDGQVSPLFPPSSGLSRAAWSPDGRRLALLVRESPSQRFREGRNVLRIVDRERDAPAETLPLRSLPDPSRRGRNAPAWDDDGIIVSNRAGLIRIQPDSGRAQVLVDADLAESPSVGGGQILFALADRLKLARSDGQEPRDVTPSLSIAPQKPPPPVTVRVPRLFDPQSGDYRRNVDIVVREGRIEAVAAAGSDEVAGELIDFSRQDVTAIPGLVESHAHVDWSSLVSGRWLDHGVTTVRNPGVDPYEGAAQKEMLRASDIAVPRLVSAGPLMTGDRVSYGIAQPNATPGHVRAEIGRHAALGLDLIKTYVRMDYRLQHHAIDAAQRAGLLTTSHELFPAVAYGVDAIEHLLGTSRRGFSWKASANMRAYQDVTALVAFSGASITPTIAMYERYSPGTGEPLGAIVMQLHQAGARIAAGTDAPFVPYGAGLHDELALYRQAGLSPAEVLRTATSAGAHIAGLEGEIGRVAPGYAADIVIVRGDPLQQFDDLRAITWVMAGGRIHRMSPE